LSLNVLRTNLNQWIFLLLMISFYFLSNFQIFLCFDRFQTISMFPKCLYQLGFIISYSLLSYKFRKVFEKWWHLQNILFIKLFILCLYNLKWNYWDYCPIKYFFQSSFQWIHANLSLPGNFRLLWLLNFSNYRFRLLNFFLIVR
jgi:hypothetical protein